MNACHVLNPDLPYCFHTPIFKSTSSTDLILFQRKTAAGLLLIRGNLRICMIDSLPCYGFLCEHNQRSPDAGKGFNITIILRQLSDRNFPNTIPEGVSCRTGIYIRMIFEVVQAWVLPYRALALSWHELYHVQP